MLTWIRAIFWAKTTLLMAIMTTFTIGCSNGNGGFHTFTHGQSSTPEEQRDDAQSTTGFRTFDNNNYSVDGDATRTKVSTEELLNGKDGDDPVLAELAKNNLSLAGSIQQVDIRRMNTRGQVTRKGRHSFHIEILSNLPETQLAPLVFKGLFEQKGDLLHIRETLSSDHGKNFVLTGTFQDLDSLKKVYATLELHAFHSDGSLKAVSKVHLRSYQANTKVRKPIDAKESSRIDAQISTLQNTKAWVTNIVVVLGRAFFDYELIDIADNSTGIEEPTNRLARIQGESLQTTGFVTKLTEIITDDNSALSPSAAHLFGANDDGTRSFRLDLKDGSDTQDIMIELKEEETEFDLTQLDPAVRGFINNEPAPRDIAPDKTSPPAQEEEEEEVFQPETPREAFASHPSAPTVSPRPQPRPTTTDPSSNNDEVITEAEESISTEELTVDEAPNEIEVAPEQEEDKPGFITRVWNYIWGSDESSELTIDDAIDTAVKEAMDNDIELPEEAPPAPAVEVIEPSVKETTTEQAVLVSLRPRPRPTKNWPPEPVGKKPQRNVPDIKINGVQFGLSDDAFLKINYDEKALPRVAKGLRDMEQHYGYKDIRNHWIPYMRDKRGASIRQFWKWSYPVRDLISQVFEAYDVLPTLAYVTILESGFSKSGKFEVELSKVKNKDGELISTAFGPFQLLRDTAAGYGLRTDIHQRVGTKPASWDERNWFVPSLCGAAKHFEESLRIYGRVDVTWAIMAYHTGNFGATEEIAEILKKDAGALWKSIQRFSYTYQEIKAYKKLENQYFNYVDQKIASYFILQSPAAMEFSLPDNIQKDIPEAHKHKFFPSKAIKDSECEAASKNWRPYFNRALQ